MVRRSLKRSDLENEPYLSWNTFVDLIALTDFEDLNEAQKPAHLIFWYDAEVYNGGHLQYFLNSAGRRASETVEVLSKLDLSCQKTILADAIAFATRNPIPEIESTAEFVAVAFEGRFNEFDLRYAACPIQLQDFLEQYLEQNFSEFIELI